MTSSSSKALRPLRLSNWTLSESFRLEMFWSDILARIRCSTRRTFMGDAARPLRPVETAMTRVIAAGSFVVMAEAMVSAQTPIHVPPAGIPPDQPARRQLRAARALLSWSQERLAQESGVSPPTIKRLEPGEGSLQTKVETMKRLQAALEAAGVEFTNGGQPGVQDEASFREGRTLCDRIFRRVTFGARRA